MGAPTGVYVAFPGAVEGLGGTSTGGHRPRGETAVGLQHHRTSAASGPDEGKRLARLPSHDDDALSDPLNDAIR